MYSYIMPQWKWAWRPKVMDTAQERALEKSSASDVPISGPPFHNSAPWMEIPRDLLVHIIRYISHEDDTYCQRSMRQVCRCVPYSRIFVLTSISPSALASPVEYMLALPQPKEWWRDTSCWVPYCYSCVYTCCTIRPRNSS